MEKTLSRAVKAMPTVSGQDQAAMVLVYAALPSALSVLLTFIHVNAAVDETPLHALCRKQLAKFALRGYFTQAFTVEHIAFKFLRVDFKAKQSILSNITDISLLNV